jgi:predicted Zn-dependent protease with MMP-like domain
MLKISDAQFEGLISAVMDELPDHYASEMDNVAITWAEDPTLGQRTQMQLRAHQTLFGLYEGIPLTKRGAGYSLVLPDKITLFKNPLVYACGSLEALKAQIKHTLWHEIAHHYGLDHDNIHGLEAKKADS